MYEAFFIKEPLTSTLERDIEYKHITVAYKPEKDHSEFYGMIGKFNVIGYGNDGKNEGLLVELVSVEIPDINDVFCDVHEMYLLAKSIPVPHITLSVSKDGKPVDTGKLNFDQPIPDEFKDQIIIGTFGGFINKPYFK